MIGSYDTISPENFISSWLILFWTVAVYKRKGFNMRKILFFILALIFHSTYAQLPQKEWTILSFQNGNNNLDHPIEDEIMRMEKVGSSDQVNLVVQWSSRSAKKTVRMLIIKSPNDDKVNSPVLQDLGFINMGSAKNLEDFIRWGIENFPAKHYFINVSNHGAGWREFPRDKDIIIGDISDDEVFNDAITTEQLGDAMKYASQLIGHKVDLYGSDACFMAMPEVANEMADSVEYSVGSEDTEPGFGWPYAKFLKMIEAKPTMPAPDMAKLLVKLYGEHYKGQADITFSAYDLKMLDEFNRAIASLKLDITAANANVRAQIVKNQDKTRFFYSEYVDIYNFVTVSAALLNPADVDKFKETFAKLVIANYASEQFKGRVNGVSVWLPVYRNWDEFNALSARYSNLRFNTATGWIDAINALMQARNSL